MQFYLECYFGYFAKYFIIHKILVSRFDSWSLSKWRDQISCRINKLKVAILYVYSFKKSNEDTGFIPSGTNRCFVLQQIIPATRTRPGSTNVLEGAVTPQSKPPCPPTPSVSFCVRASSITWRSSAQGQFMAPPGPIAVHLYR